MADVVMKQPMSVGGAPANALEYLKQLDFVKVRQKVDIVEVLLPWEVQNRYEIMDSNDQMFLYVAEESPTCQRLCCGQYRGFVLHVTDMTGQVRVFSAKSFVCVAHEQQEVARYHREFKCCAGCSCCANLDCCAFDMWVDTPVGNSVSHVRQMKYWCYPQFNIFSRDEKAQYQIQGPCCCMCQGPGCYADLEFPIYNPDGSETNAKVTKIWSGAARECCTKANTFGCYFPRDLDVEKKLSIIGSAFQIDFTFFEGEDGGEG